MTVTCEVIFKSHPNVVPIEDTVYVVVTVGFAITLIPVVVFNPVEGDQL